MSVRPFHVRVTEFLSENPIPNKEDENVFVREMIKVVLKIGDPNQSIKLKKLASGHNIVDSYSWFKSQYLDVSYRLHQILWREVINKLKDPNYSSEDVETDKDVEFCIKYMNDKDKSDVLKLKYDKRMDVRDLNLDGWQMGVSKKRDLVSHVNSKIYTLSYISKYDPALTPMDFSQELLVEAVKAFNGYSRSKGKKLTEDDKDNWDLENNVQKFMEVTLNNKIKCLKWFYSCDNRERVTSTTKKQERKLKKLKKEFLTNKCPDLEAEIKKLEEYVRENKNFYSKIYSMHVSKDETGEKVIDYGEDHLVKRCLQDRTVQEDMEQDLWMSDIFERMRHNKAKKIISVLLGYDKEIRVKVKQKRIKPETDQYFEFLVKHLDLGEEDIQYIEWILQNNKVYNDVDREDVRVIYKYFQKEARITRFIKIVIGNVFDADFEKWVQENNVTLKSYVSTINAVKKYLGLSKNEISNNVIIKEVLLPELLSYLGEAV